MSRTRATAFLLASFSNILDFLDFLQANARYIVLISSRFILSSTFRIRMDYTSVVNCINVLCRRILEILPCPPRLSHIASSYLVTHIYLTARTKYVVSPVTSILWIRRSQLLIKGSFRARRHVNS